MTGSSDSERGRPARIRRGGERSEGPIHADVRLGRIGGVEVGFSWTWLVVVALITWSLAAEVFPSSNPGFGDATYVAMALTAAALFFGSLLLHELGHALQARREGMEVSGVTLWVFGGVARFSGMFPSAGAEFRVAIAGPAVTLVLGAGFLAAAALGMPAAVDGVLTWLGFSNLLLLGFNLLPALPLDGGRVLRSALWKARGDLAWATLVAGRLGRLAGSLMIAGGIVTALSTSLVSGLWLALIGWFLVGAATQELGLISAQHALAGLRVSDVMVRSPVTVRSDAPLREVVDQVLVARPHTVYPIVDDGRALGLLRFDDVAALPPEDRVVLRVRDAMIPAEPALTVRDSDDLGDALGVLLATDVRRALVVHGGAFAGLLSITDVQRVLALRTPRGRTR